MSGIRQSPIYQLNVMLILSLPTGDQRITPIFHLSGFAIQSIGPHIAVNPPPRERVVAKSLAINNSVSPELVLERKEELIVLECKENSFGVETSQAHQARGYLVNTSAYLAQYIGYANPARWKGLLLYAVSGNGEEPMQKTVEDLSSELKSIPVDVIPANTIGLHIRNDGLYIKKVNKTPAINVQSLDESYPNPVKVIDDPDPRPIYIIPIDPNVNAHDEYGRKVLEERVRSSLAATLGSRVEEGEVEITLDEILRNSILVWDHLRGSETVEWFRNGVRAYIREILRQIAKLPAEIIIERDSFSIMNISKDQENQIRGYLMSAAFRRGSIDLWSDAVQSDFSELGEGW